MLRRRHVVCLAALVIAQGLASASAKHHNAPAPAATRSPAAPDKTAAAAAPPPLPLAAGIKEHLAPVWKATYECGGKAEDCSAGCGSASFSPIQRLTVVLGLVAIGRREVLIYYYLAEFPQDQSKKAKSAAKAEGFILDSNAVCGTVNMNLTFSDFK